MVHCCIQGCKNTHHSKGKKDDWGKDDTRNYSLHDLPSAERMDIRELWVMAIHRASLPKVGSSWLKLPSSEKYYSWDSL